MIKSFKLFAVLLSLFGFSLVTDHCSLTADVFAASKQINFQGKLTDNNGAIVPDGLKAMKFHLYPAIDATTDEWNENVNVYVSSGLFNVTLGKVNSLDGVAFSKQYWLGIDVNSVELLPRQELAASAYALGSLGDFNINGKALISGNVGIGTTSPSTQTEVSGNYIANKGQLYVTNPGISNAHAYITVNSANTASESGFMISKAGTANWWIYQMSNSDDLRFESTTGTRMTIQKGGNVGIGTTSPSTQTEVSGNYIANKGQLYVTNPGISNAHAYITVNSANTASESGFMISKAGTANWWIYQMTNSDDLRFESTTGTRMTIQKGGNVGIGRIPDCKLDVNGDIRASGVVTWSDERLKSNIQLATATGVLDKVSKLNPVKYNLNRAEMKKMKVGAKDIFEYDQKIREDVVRQTTDTAKIPLMIEARKKADDESLRYCDDTQLGVSAQELESQFPELVKTDSNGYKAVAYDRLSVVLLEAIKEQQKQIETQNRKIQDLEIKVNMLSK